jgi:tetratricopeptide (TPR) repeat protein
MIFISYSHDSPAHQDRILALSNRLRAEGIDCRIDQYEQSPSEGWPTWCDRAIEQSTFVLVACTETYLRRYKKEEPPQKSLGVTWEGHIITQQLYNAQGQNTKFIPILFRPEDSPFVPLTLQSATIYQLPDHYDLLYRRLTNQPLITMPDLGSVRPMPPLDRKQDFQTTWLVPYPRNPFFTGREKILSHLRESLTKHKRAALSGLGGLGKTQTAIEYAYRHRAEYKAIFFVKSETRETLIADFAQIAVALNLPSANAQQQEATVAEVKRWLETSSGWLLILDNADDATLAKEFLPSEFSAHVLLTTRARALGPIADPLAMQEMPPEEGALLLLRRAKLPETNQPLAAQISQELGGLPLAIDQAGAFIEETPSTLSEYLAFYNSVRSQLLADRGSLGDHPSVTVTFSLAFVKTAEHSPAAADLIRLCAFFAPDAIPEELIVSGAKHLEENLGPAAQNAFNFAKLLKQATRFSLLDRDPENKTLAIHRLVQIVIRDGMSNTEQKDWAERAVLAMAKTFPNPEFENWEFCQKLIPHAQACASLIDAWSFTFPDAARFLNNAAFYLSDRALFADAEPLYRRSLAIREKALGPAHREVATALNNLAELHRNQGKYAKAEPLYQRALMIWEQALGPDHPNVATSLNNLALLYDEQGKYVEAEPLYQRSLAIREKSLGPDHPKVATALNNLAELHRNQRKYANAEPLYQRALTIWEKALGPDHPNVASSLNNLALLYNDQGKYAAAEPLYQRALAILDKALGHDHPTTLTVRSNLARNRRSSPKD